MIHLVDQALEDFLRQAVPLPIPRIDVSFKAPDKTWGASLNRPTVNCFLWAVSRDPRAAASGHQQREVDGQIERRNAPVRVVLGYVITTWATDERDEHQLLGSVMQAVLSAPRLPDVHVPEALHGVTPIRLSLGSRDERGAGEFWSALGGQLQAGLSIEISMSVDVEDWSPTSPAPSEIELTVGDGLAPVTGKVDDDDADAPAIARSRRHGAVVAERLPER